jgi:hypothetical protein
LSRRRHWCPRMTTAAAAVHYPAQPPFPWAGTGPSPPGLHYTEQAPQLLAHCHSLFWAATLHWPSRCRLCRPQHGTPAYTTPDARNTGDQPTVDLASRPPLSALVAPIGHLFTLRLPPSADLDAAVNSGEVSIFSNFVFWIWNMNVRMDCFDLNVRRKLIWFECYNELLWSIWYLV